MIIKIDHIALSSGNLDWDIKLWSDLGYKLKFLENRVKNLKIKRKLMKNFSPVHSLAFLEKKGSFNVELIDHGHIIPGRPFIISSEKYKKRPKSDFNFNKILIRTENMVQSCKFLELFGFKTVKKSKNSAQLNFKSIFSRIPLKINLIAEPGKGAKETFLDNQGFNCLAFISTSILEDKKLVDNAGYQTTNIEKIKLNGKLLKIFFAKGSNGELAEIIGIIR